MPTPLGQAAAPLPKHVRKICCSWPGVRRRRGPPNASRLQDPSPAGRSPGLPLLPAPPNATGLGPRGGLVEAAQRQDHPTARSTRGREERASAIRFKQSSRATPITWASGTKRIDQWTQQIETPCARPAARRSGSQAHRAGCQTRREQETVTPTAGKAPITALGGALRLRPRASSTSAEPPPCRLALRLPCWRRWPPRRAATKATAVGGC